MWMLLAVVVLSVTPGTGELVILVSSVEVSLA
jgi:hypothetical protein